MYNYTSIPTEEAIYHPICKIEELPIGQRLFVEIGKNPIVLFNIAGKYFAIGDVCSHDNGPLGDGEVEGVHIKCPRHGAKFDILTGKVLSLPAVEDIPAYPIRVNEGYIEIGLPR
jgi:3-phenylpropionate/trans-cinnamate dioxygenase ferredoxin subunit